MNREPASSPPDLNLYFTGKFTFSRRAMIFFRSEIAFKYLLPNRLVNRDFRFFNFGGDVNISWTSSTRDRFPLIVFKSLPPHFTNDMV